MRSNLLTGKQLFRNAHNQRNGPSHRFYPNVADFLPPSGLGPTISIMPIDRLIPLCAPNHMVFLIVLGAGSLNRFCGSDLQRV